MERAVRLWRVWRGELKLSHDVVVCGVHGGCQSRRSLKLRGKAV